MVADVKAKSVIAAVQLALGHPACAGVGCAGGSVVTLKARLPFLISLAGSDWLPVTVTSPGFWPGAWLPPWFVHVVVGSAVDAAGDRVEGFVGAEDPFLAVTAALEADPYDEVIVSTLPARISHWLHLDLPARVPRLGLPVTVVTAKKTDRPFAPAR
jgi:hypothetical protein